MATATDYALHDKIIGIARGDYKEGIQSLKLVFEQRKKCAELMLSCDSSSARDFIELCNEEIRKVLYL